MGQASELTVGSFCHKINAHWMGARCRPKKSEFTWRLPGDAKSLFTGKNNSGRGVTDTAEARVGMILTEEKKLENLAAPIL